MKMERPNAKPLSAEDMVHLEKLKSVIEKALKDGEFSVDEIERIQSIIWTDGKVTYEELRTIHETIQSVMGDIPPELEWLKN